jgi:hypothetical protein
MTLNITTLDIRIKCHYAEFHYADCRYAVPRYAECRGALKNNEIKILRCNSAEMHLSQKLPRLFTKFKHVLPLFNYLKAKVCKVCQVFNAAMHLSQNHLHCLQNKYVLPLFNYFKASYVNFDVSQKGKYLVQNN